MESYDAKAIKQEDRGTGVTRLSERFFRVICQHLKDVYKNQRRRETRVHDPDLLKH
jgi:hypothetical protein